MNILRRLLANGPLTGYPTRRTDEDLLLRMAASRFEFGRSYREAEVNEILRTWLDTFCAPYGIDHVTMRRRLVDTRFLVRDTAGTEYHLAAAKARELVKDTTLNQDPAHVLEEIRHEREARKRQHVPSDVQ